ncbi:uncharacterized protein LDX57_008207 [Aspergillus melleus]|uniref:uncharacterized protein n=1 Tax=Aspergillus melleus TaxID=138277 RepID=UPI001E8E0D87|nr:uncharacterized protein LDX57_008207 [Aspergillus melleus]KAH8430543.1 hypothetical protein LDX57_008207 [Aspergillus melleus]
MHISQAGPNSYRKICLSPAVASLIQSGVDSARTILRILRVLGDEDLMETFLPFQLEDAFSSAFVLQLIRAVAPWLLPDETWSEDVESIFGRMIAKGNVVAPLRQVELGQLAQVMTPLTPNELHFQSPSPRGEPSGNEPSVVFGEEEPSWELFIGNAIVDLNSGEILDLAAQLDVDPRMYSMDI